MSLSWIEGVVEESSSLWLPYLVFVVSYRCQSPPAVNDVIFVQADDDSGFVE